MRIIFGDEICVLCHLPGVYLIGSKPNSEYFIYQWYCENCFHDMSDELKKCRDFNRSHGEKAEFKIL
jgi:hypothetical protein